MNDVILILKNQLAIMEALVMFYKSDELTEQIIETRARLVEKQRGGPGAKYGYGP